MSPKAISPSGVYAPFASGTTCAITQPHSANAIDAMSARIPTVWVYRDRMDFSTILLWAAVPIFLGVAVQGLFAPQRILVPLGGKLDTPSVANEIRANYGGMHFGIAVLMALGALKPEWRTPML